MQKLIKNNVMKLILCAVMFCGTNFGMEKEGRKEQERRLQQQRVKNQKEDDDVCNQRCLKSCERWCLFACPATGLACFLLGLRVVTDDNFR